MAVNALSSAALTFASMVSSSSANAHVCDGPRAEVRASVASSFDQQAQDLWDTIRTLESTGNATSKKLASDLRDQLRSAKSQKVNEANQQVISQCKDELAPAQNIMDDIVAGVTGGISLVLPKGATHVEVGEILDGNILGGENSFFRKELGIKW
jgi:hypothetical protein